MSIKPLSEVKKKPRMVKEPIPCPNDRPFLWGIISRTGQGKSVTVANLLRRPEFYFRKFDKVFFATSNVDEDGEITDKAYDLIEFDDDNVYTDFDEVIFEDIKKRILTDKDWKDKNYLLVIDDLPYALRNNKVGKILLKHRHINLSIIFTTQKTNIVSRLVRSNMTNVSIYKSLNKDELQDLNNVIDIDKNEFKQLLEYATSEPYNFLFIDILKPRFYKNFTEELIIEKQP
jgi:hypothetical protein